MNDPCILFGGSFDPVHQAHLQAALEVSRQFGGTPVNFLPAALSPLKTQTFASDRQRLDMLEVAIAPWPCLTINTFEIHRPPPSYTFLTLQHFHHARPQSPLILVMGADSFATLHQWRHWQQFSSLCHLAILPRPDAPAPDPAVLAQFPEADVAQLKTIRCGLRIMLAQPQIPLSSTQIRQQIAAGEPCALPPGVREYIDAQKLYRAAL